MPAVERQDLYVHPSWLAKLMAGEATCEWAAWFRAHYKDWARPPSDFDAAKYDMLHTRLSREVREQQDPATERIFVERQAEFWYTHPSGIRISGRPDMVTFSPSGNIIHDAKTGIRRKSHRLQVLIYMYCLPRSDRWQFQGKTFGGQLHYPDGMTAIGAEDATGVFEDQFKYWLDLLASQEPLGKFPSAQECRFCNIGAADCAERMADGMVADG